MMKAMWVIGMCMVSVGALADDGRYQALPLGSGEAGKGGARAFVIDTRDGHVWIWSENELMADADGRRRYAAGFVYQGKLRPGVQPGEFIETPRK